MLPHGGLLVIYPGKIRPKITQATNTRLLHSDSYQTGRIGANRQRSHHWAWTHAPSSDVYLVIFISAMSKTACKTPTQRIFSFAPFHLHIKGWSRHPGWACLRGNAWKFQKINKAIDCTISIISGMPLRLCPTLAAHCVSESISQGHTLSGHVSTGWVTHVFLRCRIATSIEIAPCWNNFFWQLSSH